jgi:hypothetical protein
LGKIKTLCSIKAVIKLFSGWNFYFSKQKTPCFGRVLRNSFDVRREGFLPAGRQANPRPSA